MVPVLVVIWYSTTGGTLTAVTLCVTITDTARNAADNNKFVPFVLESTGRLGVEARRFLDSLTKIRGSQFTKKDFLNEISALMAQASARMRLNGQLRAERLIGSVV